jgi:RND family efflux transporter MFP subunit
VPVPSSQLPRVAVGAPVEFTIDAWPGRTFTGRVSFINPTVDDASRSARVVVEVANADGLLKGGLFARGRIVTGKRSAVLQVPRVAVLNWNVGNHSGDVFVVADGRASKRGVQTGTASDDAIEITAGLAAGDTVVTRGGFALRPGDRIQVAAPKPGE